MAPSSRGESRLPGERQPGVRNCALTLAIALVVTTPAAPTQAAPSPSAPCRWVARPPYVQVAERAPIPLLARAESADGRAVDPAPAPTYAWNPDLTRHGRMHLDANGDDSSLVTVSGGGCAQTLVAVFVYTDGHLAQRSIALDYGDSQAHDEFSSGASEFGTVNGHGEFAEPFGVRHAWFSADARSIGYVHRSGDVANVGPGTALEPTFGVRDSSLESRAGFELARDGPVAEVAYLAVASNTARPNVGGFGIALEVPPQLTRTFGAYGALAYYPNLTGGGVRLRAVRFRGGLTLSLLPFLGRPFYFELAAVGDRRSAAARARTSTSFQGLVTGVGYRFGSRL
jgi:hypothetical protein